MAIQFNCPMCGASLIAPDNSVGREIRCVGCRAVFPVPEAREEPFAEPLPVDPPLFEKDPPYQDDPPYRDDPRRADDYDDEPRRRPVRRRRRRPPPPPGRGVAFWLVFIFGVLAIGGCACCGGIYLAIPGERWQKHESVQGGFKVDLPATPKTDMPIPGVKPDPKLKVEGAILWKRGEFYTITYADIAARNVRLQTDEALLDEAVRSIETEREVQRVVRKDPIGVCGFPGREIEFVSTDGGTYVARVIIADTRLYVLIGGGRFVGPNNANIRRFLDSFEITDKRLAGGAQHER